MTDRWTPGTIEYISSGDIVYDESEVLVDPVNAAGKSGGGLALHFKNIFPEEEQIFIERSKANKLRMGTVFVVPILKREQKIAYFPTKISPRQGDSVIRDIYEGLVALRQYLVQNDIESVAIPALGCGLGGLEFELVKRAIEYVFQHWKFQIRVRVYLPREEK